MVHKTDVKVALSESWHHINQVATMYRYIACIKYVCLKKKTSGLIFSNIIKQVVIVPSFLNVQVLLLQRKKNFNNHILKVFEFFFLDS